MAELGGYYFSIPNHDYGNLKGDRISVGEGEGNG